MGGAKWAGVEVGWAGLGGVGGGPALGACYVSFVFLHCATAPCLLFVASSLARCASWPSLVHTCPILFLLSLTLSVNTTHKQQSRSLLIPFPHDRPSNPILPGLGKGSQLATLNCGALNFFSSFCPQAV